MKKIQLILASIILLLPILSFSQYIDNNKIIYPTKEIPQLNRSTADEQPYINSKVHKNGRFWNTILNNGIIGNFFGDSDEETGFNAPNYYFPRHIAYRHAFSTGLWVGGVIGRDTLVSEALSTTPYYWWRGFKSEMWPDIYPFGDFQDLSSNAGGVQTKDDFARSQIQFQAFYTDTFTSEDLVPYSTNDERLHKPLNIEIRQTSFSWSYQYAEDIIIIDYAIRNIGNKDIKDMYVGFLHNGANHYVEEQPFPKMDDIPGLLDSIPYEFEELGYEQMNIAWTLDFNGASLASTWSPMATRDAFGIAPLDLPESAYNINFNWWSNDYGRSWGPRKKGTGTDPLRMYNGEFGMPTNDKERYHMLSHPERDYNGYFAAVDKSRQGWIKPFEYADKLVTGFEVHYLLSFGPFDLKPGRAERVTIAMAIGENVHKVPGAYFNYFDAENPLSYMTMLDFSDLIDNMRWAKRIYDNPGVDTDSDGDSGKYFFQVDTLTNDSIQIFYEGDGVPDFSGASPPPSPLIRVKAKDGQIAIRWNGKNIENYFDTFSLIKDFEGYRVYIARSVDENDISLLSTYDQENYSRFRWNSRFQDYELKETPFTMDSLRILYGDDFEPLEYTRTHPFIDKKGVYFFFIKVDNNDSDFRDHNEIHKIYPDAINDTLDVDEEGRMRYFEYEYVINNLLPTVPYYVTVTAFDFGYPAKSLMSLESSRESHRVKVYAIDSDDDVVIKNGKLNVFVYPNPYRVDANYASLGIENRFSDLYIERARSIFFVNLPNKCTISIYTLDGDLIRKIEHDQPIGSGESAIERFNLITRNTQALETGLYYWVVESAYGNQVGKMTIIK